MQDFLSLCPLPLIQAPMAGGATTPELVAAVSAAGGLGSLAAALLPPLAIIEQAELIRRLTDKPFAINLFVLSRPRPADEEVEAARAVLRPFCHELGWDSVPVPARWCLDFEEQLEAVITARPAVASFTFDVLHGSQIQRLHDAGILVVGTATTLAEAQVWQAMGADAVCLQGTEAGGHRGTFIGQQEAATLGLHELLAQCLPHMHIPLIAAGGLMSAQDIARIRAEGAALAQLGTAFLCCHESGIPEVYKERLLAASSDTTRQTRAISGRLARGLDNRLMRLLDKHADRVPAYPVQNALTTAIRAEAARHDNPELMSLWAGQGVARCQRLSAAELVQQLMHPSS